MSSKPTRLTSPGTSRPARCNARRTPSAIWSLATKIAVTSGVCGEPAAELVSGAGAPVADQRWRQLRAGVLDRRAPALQAPAPGLPVHRAGDVPDGPVAQ